MYTDTDTAQAELTVMTSLQSMVIMITEHGFY